MGTIVGWLALSVGGLALGYAWKLGQELTTAGRRLDRYNRAIFDATDQIRTLREELANAQAQLRAEMARQNGRLQVHPEMTIREVQALHPQVAQVMAGFHLGGCSSCAVEPDASLSEICATSGTDLTQLTESLNTLLQLSNSQKGANGSTPIPVRLPNVELTL